MLWWTPVARPRGTTWRRSAWKPHAPCVRPWRRRSGLFFFSLMMLLPVYLYVYMYIFIYACAHIWTYIYRYMNTHTHIYICVYAYNHPELWKWTNEEFCSSLKMNNSRKNKNYASNRELFPYFLFWEMPGNPQPGMTGVCGKNNCQQKG